MTTSTKNDNLDSSILRLQSLETEFDLVMTQYKQAYLDYISSLQTTNGNNNEGGREFTSLQGRRFWGTGGIKDITVNNADECKASCAEDLMCTGATFNSSSGYCWIRSGNGDVTVSSNNNEYALMPSVSQNTNNLKMLNDKLIKLNIDIMNELNSNEPIVFNQVENKNVKKSEMENTNKELIKERINIMKLMDQYDDLMQQYDSNSIYVRQANASYMVWSFISISLIIIIIKLILTPEVKLIDNINFLIKLFLFFVLIVSITKLNHPAAFAIFGLLIIMLIFKIMNKIGSGSGSGSGSSGRSGYGLGQPGSSYNSYSQR